MGWTAASFELSIAACLQCTPSVGATWLPPAPPLSPCNQAPSTIIACTFLQGPYLAVTDSTADNLMYAFALFFGGLVRWRAVM